MPRLRAGSLLISQPFLGDPNFERSVVLLCQHTGADGSFGLVLNRLSTLHLADVLELPVPADSPVARLPLYLGGPVQPDTLHYLHQQPSVPGAVALGQGVYWGGDFQELLGRLLSGELAPEAVRFYAGYSGWTGGQLGGEIGEAVWIVFPDAAGKVFTLNPEAFWQAVLREKGGRYRALSNYPIDPRLN